MKTLNQILFFTLFMGFAAFGQQESEIKSDGIVFPRLTTYPASPTLGQVIYYDTNTRFEYWDGASWQAFTSGGGTADLIEDGVDNDTYVKAIENGATDKIEIDVEGENPVTIYNDQLFINRTANLSTTEAFGIRKEVTSAAFGGMFMETNGDPSSKPYYGFGINGIVHSWIYHDGASDEVRIYNSGERLSLSNTGFLKINNVYTLPNVDGTPNQYLQTNGNGTASWADAPVSNLIEDSDGDTKVEAINGASDYINMEVEGATGSLEIKSVGSGDIAIEFLNSTNSDNIIIGEGAGEDIGTSANNNIFIGTIAGNKTTTGDDNIYIGRSAGALNILGTRNTFVGRRAGYQNTENDNTFIGNRAGTNSMNSRESVFVGSSAGETAEGINNTAIGFEAAELIDLGEDNVFLGHLTGKNSSDGDENVGIGAQSLFNVGDGSENVALGYSALKNTGSSGATSLTASGNVGAGFEAGLNNDSGYDNTFIGFRSGYNNTTGNNNVYNGYQSGYTNTTALYNVMIGSGTGRNASGSYNSYLGHDAGRNNDGDNNVFLGHEAGMNAPNVSNTLVISNDKDKELIYGEFNNDKVGINSTTMNAHLHIKQTSAGTNTITFENDASGGNDYWSWQVGANDLDLWYDPDGPGAAVATDVAAVDDSDGSWDTPSDRNLKEDFKDIPTGTLDKVMKLKAQSYYYKADQEKSRRSIGFIAQDVKELFPDIINDEGKYLKMSYADFGVIAIKAIQEQQMMIEKLENEMAALKNQNAILNDDSEVGRTSPK